MNFFARVISFISNPFVIFLLVPYIVVYRESQNSLYAFKWAVFSCLFLAIVGVFVLYGVKKGFFSDFDISKKNQRAVLFLFASLVTFLFLLSVVFLDGPRILLIALVSIILGVLIVSVVNMRIKASLHVATISGFIVSLSIIYDGVFLLGLILIPIVAWARVVRKKHTVNETLIGGLLGGALSIIAYFLVKYFYA